MSVIIISCLSLSLFSLFSEAEFQMIRGLTIKELLIAVTNNVTQDNIQDDPFLVSANLSHCPQPYQLSRAVYGRLKLRSQTLYYTRVSL